MCEMLFLSHDHFLKAAADDDNSVTPLQIVAKFPVALNFILLGVSLMRIGFVDVSLEAYLHSVSSADCVLIF